MKKQSRFVASLLLAFSLAACGVSSSPSVSSSSNTSLSSSSQPSLACDTTTPYPELNTVPGHVSDEAYASFRFFWEAVNTQSGSPGYGLIRDRYPGNPNLASVASVGFGLSAIVIGVERDWITCQEGYDRVNQTFDTLANLARWNGYYYHFYTMGGQPASGSEISTVDTGLMMMGVLHAAEYFGGDVRSKGRALYEGVNWLSLVEPSSVALPRFYMGYDIGKQENLGKWDYYAEQLLLYFLGSGSPTHPTARKTYSSFTRSNRTSPRTGETYIHSWFGSIFTYQYSHAWIDFRNINDFNGINWFENSVRAVRDNHAYATLNPEGFETWSSLAWGMSAGDSPDGYDGYLGSPLSGSNDTAHRNDGTIVPYGALGSIVFLPEEAIASSEYYTNVLGTNLIGTYGYKSAFNFENGQWFAPDVIGIDKGITLLMIENYRTGMIWDQFMKIDYMQNAIDVLDFVPVVTE